MVFKLQSKRPTVRQAYALRVSWNFEKRCLCTRKERAGVAIGGERSDTHFLKRNILSLNAVRLARSYQTNLTILHCVYHAFGEIPVHDWMSRRQGPG